MDTMYWLGPGVLSWKRNGTFVKPNEIIPEEVLKFLGEKRVKFFLDLKQMSYLTPDLARRQLGNNNQEALKKAQSDIAALKTAISILTENNADLEKRNKELSETPPDDSPAFKKLESAYKTKCEENKKLKTEFDDLTSTDKSLKKYNDKLHKTVAKLEKKLTKKGIPFTDEDLQDEGKDVILKDGQTFVDTDGPAGPG